MAAGLGDALTARLREGRPYLGICLGMQVLFETSEEAEGARGLGLFRGRVRRLAPGVDEATGRARPLPHIGWNTAVPTESGARSAIGDEPEHFYFAHSYAVEPADASLVAATTEYGERFASAISAPKLLGVQFHPEKSQRAGVALLRRFFESLGH
jgi:glutamine amidotransferase